MKRKKKYDDDKPMSDGMKCGLMALALFVLVCVLLTILGACHAF